MSTTVDKHGIATPTRHPGSLVKELDLDKARFLGLVERAAELKVAKATGTERARLTGRNIAVISENSSTRTRCAFEVAAHDQGAHVTYVGPERSHIGREESIPDTARVLGRMFDGIEYRGSGQNIVELLADHAGVPVWNGLTDEWHPTQMLADILTMVEHRPQPPVRISYAFLGDGRNNVARSLLVTGALLGMDVRIAAPHSLWPPDHVVEIARRLAAGTDAQVLITDDAHEAVRDVDFVYTDRWVSTGEPADMWDTRVPLLLPYRVTEELMASSGTPDTKFMHCLPAVHDRSTPLGQRLFEKFGLDGAEVTDEVFSSRRSIAFYQAENRMHTIKAVLVDALAR